MRIPTTTIAIALMITMLLAGCSSYTGQSVASEPIEIGGVFHLTGAGAFWGESELNGAMMAIEETNSAGGVSGRKLKLVVEDGATDFTKTATAFNKLIEFDGRDILMGPTWFGQVASPIAKEKEVLILSQSTGVISAPSKYYFTVWPTVEQDAVPVLEWMNKTGKKRVMVVYSQNDWSASVKDAFIENAEEYGVDILSVYETDPAESDFRAIILKMSLDEFDTVYAPLAYYPALGYLTKQIKELDMFNATITSASGTENPALLSQFQSVEGVYYPYPVITKETKRFNKRYLDRYGKMPGPSAAYAYDTARMLINGMEAGARDADSMSSYLGNVKGYEGLSGNISFNSRGRRTDKQFEIKMIRNGSFIKAG